jgi:diguanylate cyclase (GGDEF)-like protein
MVRVNHVNRSICFVMAFSLLALTLWDRSLGLEVWGVLILNCFAYPQLVYWAGTRVSHPRRCEQAAMLLDAALFGAWSAYLGFPGWISFTLVASVLVGLTLTQGLRAGLLGMLSAALAVGVVYIWRGLDIQFETTPLQTGLSMLWLIAYLLLGASNAYQRAFELLRARQQLSVGLDEIRTLQSRLSDMANRDSLTGLFNRRFFSDTLERELLRCKREGRPLCCMLMDLDHFKRINDTWGHQAGDEVLCAVAKLLSEHARRSDLICRYGGEEFLLLQFDITPEVALERAETLRRKVEALRFQWAGVSAQMTTSVGISHYPRNVETGVELIRQADLALYAAKAAGRNRCVSSVHLVSEVPNISFEI